MDHRAVRCGKDIDREVFISKLKQKSPNTVFLDGDVLREVFGNDLGYTREERIKCAMRYARLCKMLQEQGLNVICCTISMFDCIRAWNRENIENYREIYVRVSMEVLKQRNQKGLYSTSTEVPVENDPPNTGCGSVDDTVGKDVAGIHVNVEEPKDPDMILDNEGSVSVSKLAESVLERFGETEE